MNRQLVLALALTLLIGTLAVAFSVQMAEASGTIYIRADGSIDPPDAPISTADNVTYTLTDNINSDAEGIVVEKDNIEVDGAGYTLQGSGVYHLEYKGISLLERSNVTIKNMTIKAFDYGINLTNSYNNKIVGNNITNNNGYGIYLDYSSDNSIIGNNITNSYGRDLVLGTGIALYHSSNISVVGNNITNNKDYGITLWESSGNTAISGNDITANNLGGIWLGYSSNYNSISDNNITANNDYGIYLYSSSGNSVSGNNITNNKYGIILDSSPSNSLSENNVTNNGYGMHLQWSSSNNNIYGNDITNSGYSIDFWNSSDNKFHHNNFVNNTREVNDYSWSNPWISQSINTWDDGLEGNYWSNFTGVDSNHDGLSETPYVVGANNTDHYPLMGVFQSNNVTYFTMPLVAHSCNVTVISNSTISDFVAPIWIEHPEVIFLQFNVSGAEGSMGFCRVSFPTAMMNGTYYVSVNGTEIPCTLLPCSDANCSYLYFTYTHSTEKVIIIPEFPSFLILPLLMMTILLAVIVYKKRYVKPQM